MSSPNHEPPAPRTRQVRLLLVPSDLPLLAVALRAFGRELVGWRALGTGEPSWAEELFEVSVRGEDEVR